MTNELRLQRGRVNYEAGKFLDNQETMDYAATVKTETPKEAKNAKSDK
jgi:hypothetical protein